MGFGSSLKKAAKKVGRSAKRGARAYGKAARRSVKATWKVSTAGLKLGSKLTRGASPDPWSVEGRQELGVATAAVATAALAGGATAAALAGSKLGAAKGLSFALGGSASDSVGYDATQSSFGARASLPTPSSGNGWGTGGTLALFIVVGLAIWKGAT